MALRLMASRAWGGRSPVVSVGGGGGILLPEPPVVTRTEVFTMSQSLRAVTLLLLVAIPAAAQPGKADRQGFKDPPLFTRMPGFFLSYPDSVVEKPFGGFSFPIKGGQKRVEGRYAYYRYRYDESRGPIPSGLQIVRNYQAAATKIGGTALDGYADGRATTLQIVRDGTETWVQVMPYYGGKEYHVVIVVKQAMQQEVTANAEVMRDGLTQQGHVEVPGLYFDFNKAELKPESRPALDELVKLLKGTPSLRVWVVGHTDYVGAAESNMALSRARAAAVVEALTASGIAAARLAPFGNGPYAPIATNATDEGRAKNRRVELVAQPR